MSIGPSRSTRPESQIHCNGATAGLLVLSALSAMALCSTACMAATGRIRWTATWLTAAATASLLVSALCCCRRPVQAINRDPRPAGAAAQPIAVEPQAPRPPNPELLPHYIRPTFYEIRDTGGINPADIERPRTLLGFTPHLRAGMRCDVIQFQNVDGVDAIEADIAGKCEQLRRTGALINERHIRSWQEVVAAVREAPGSQLFVRTGWSDPYYQVTGLDQDSVSVAWWRWNGQNNEWATDASTIIMTHGSRRLLFVLLRRQECGT
jgi:hypothetical protein